MSIISDGKTLDKMLQVIKFDNSINAGARLFLRDNSDSGEKCLLVEMARGKTVEEKISRLLRFLPTARTSRRISVTISVAFLAVIREVETTLSAAVLKKIAQHQVHLHITAYSMKNAQAYKDMMAAKAKESLP